MLMVGCSYSTGTRIVGGGDDGGPRDGILDVPDAPPDAFDPLLYGQNPFTIRLTSEPTTPFDQTSQFSVAIDTTGTTTCESGLGKVMTFVGGTDPVCVIA